MKVVFTVLIELAFISCIYAAASRSTTENPEPTPSPDFDCPDLESNYYPHPTNCSAYYHCTNGLAWYRECPAGLYFNFETNSCDFPENVECNAVTENPELLGVTMIGPDPDYKCDPENNGAFPHADKCEYFYDCYNGEAWLALCTDMQLFDLKYHGCNHAEQVDCGERERPEGYPTLTPTTTPRPGHEFECPELNGNFPDPKDCASYYVCSGGFPYHMTCQDPLVYNPKLELCDYRDDDICGDRP